MPALNHQNNLICDCLYFRVEKQEGQSGGIPGAMRGTIKVIICSFLDLWFSNSILPSGKSKKPSCLLVMRWTISILPEFLENYLWFSWFFIFIIIITWEKQEGQSDGGSPATLHVFNHYVLPDDHWCLLSFVVCVFDFPYHRMEESGRSKWGKTKGFALQPLSRWYQLDHQRSRQLFTFAVYDQGK